MANELLGNGASLNGKDADGETPLHVASKEGEAATVQLLLLKGTDQHVLNTDGKTPFNLANNQKTVLR